MKARRSHSKRGPSANPQVQIDRSLCVLVAIDLAAIVAAAWLCASVPESLEPWAHTASAADATRVGAATAACE